MTDCVPDRLTDLTLLSCTESNEIPTVQPHPEQIQQRPFAQLIG